MRSIFTPDPSAEYNAADSPQKYNVTDAENYRGTESKTVTHRSDTAYILPSEKDNEPPNNETTMHPNNVAQRQRLTD